MRGEREAGQRTAHGRQEWGGQREKKGIWGMPGREVPAAPQGSKHCWAGAEPTRCADDPGILGPGEMTRGLVP